MMKRYRKIPFYCFLGRCSTLMKYITLLGYPDGNFFSTATDSYILCGRYNSTQLGFATLCEHPELPGAYIVVRFLALEDTEHLKNSI